MFDFLRNLRDEVVAWTSVNIGGLDYTADENKIPSAEEIEYDENGEYLHAIGAGANTGVYVHIMTEIRNKNLSTAPIDKISSIIHWSMEYIRDTLQVYSVMNFLKSKSYSADEAKKIMRIADIFDKDKDAKEIAKLADCTVDEVNAVISLLNEFGNGENFKPFTIENAIPNSGQVPVAPSPRRATSKTKTKKTANASA